jgi:hypothetical protein
MFKFDKISLSKETTAPSVERVVEFSPPGVDIENISKILSLAVDGKCVSVTAYEGYADVEGRVNFKLIYLDAESVPKGVDYNADFTVKVEGGFLPEDMPRCAIEIVEADVEADDTLKLSAVIEVSVSAVGTQEIEVLTDAEKCFKTNSKVCLPSFVCSKAVAVPVEDEFQAGEVESVLLLDTACIVKKAEAGEGTVAVDAVCFATVTYTDNGQISAKTLEIPFSEEITAEGALSGDSVYADAFIKGGKIVLTGVSNDNVVRFEGDAVLKVHVFRCSETEVVADMFMLTNEIELQRGSAGSSFFSQEKYFTERISGTAMLGENRAAARDIVAVPYARCYTAKAETGEDGLTVEGVINADIIYGDENGYNSVRAEVPFSLMIAGEFDENVKVKCVIEDISARVKRDREIEVNVLLGLAVYQYGTAAAQFVTGVVLGEEKEQNTSALSLYIASEGDGMWEVCKALTATPDEILRQNPALATPFEGGEKVIFFRVLK